jgi:hypothetical protein
VLIHRGLGPIPTGFGLNEHGLIRLPTHTPKHTFLANLSFLFLGASELMAKEGFNGPNSRPRPEGKPFSISSYLQ